MDPNGFRARALSDGMAENARAEKDRAVRVFLLSVAIILTLTIGISRIYLGVHWPTDVIAGWCAGGTWAVLASFVVRNLQRRDKIDVPTGTNSRS